MFRNFEANLEAWTGRISDLRSPARWSTRLARPSARVRQVRERTVGSPVRGRSEAGVTIHLPAKPETGDSRRPGWH
jgi:hypothetical protein